MKNNKQIRHILWNQFHPWESVIVGSQHFSGSWGRNFISSKFYFCKINTCTKQFSVTDRKPLGSDDDVHGDVNLCARETHYSHEHRPPRNNDDSTVFYYNRTTNRNQLMIKLMIQNTVRVSDKNLYSIIILGITFFWCVMLDISIWSLSRSVKLTTVMQISVSIFIS